MNLKNFIKTNAMALLAIGTIGGFSAFKASNMTSGKSLIPVTVQFQGNPAIQSQVEDESMWTTSPNGQTCDGANQKSCNIPVDHTDLNSSGTALNPSRITLGSSLTSSGNYIPTKTGGSSTTPFNPVNRN
ncbi:MULTISPECIES: hypothetical protein [unclassified Sphingobacterium]|uniref:hypothetical protein n=1 Tax=unclassified Sphingobacterium TaxID=2609468 RepID=UPI0010517C3C|nr:MULTISPECIES: hypothetical protein [unclassified Sphingobacterium]MCS3553573.1 ABC-type uncharacterized transport system permease subunit [Sphingobacterium sp. JUb21]TCR09219.1 hypothetical protein EDF66_10211 [Sphingobacterium sp. JUb20]